MNPYIQSGVKYLDIVIQVLGSIHLLIPFLLVLIYYYKIIFTNTTFPTPSQGLEKKFKFGIIITAHRESIFIPPIIDSILKQTYASFEVYVVADLCEISVADYPDSRIHILKPAVALSSNVKSIKYALDHFSADIDVMTLFDPDNLVHPCFFEELNKYYNRGYQAVQAAVEPKNMRGKYARIDSVGMLFYSFVDRNVRSLMGLSVNIWGCGISIMTDVFRKISFDVKSDLGGFDKHMQAEIALHVPLIVYAPKAIVFDEKVTDSKNLENQRIRWINSWFKFLGEGVNVFSQGLKRKNFNLLYFGFNLLRPPYFLLVFFGLVCMAVNFLFFFSLFIYWTVCFAVFILSIILILGISQGGEALKGVVYLPLFFYHQLRSLINLRLNKKSMLQTAHFEVLYIDDMLKK